MTTNPANRLIPPANPQAAKKKILVVDDNPGIRHSLRRVLREDGYDVVLAADGREGIEQFDAEQIALVLLDVSLPDIGGWDVFGTISSANPFVPIIIITGRDEQRELAVLSGVAALIEKPLDVPRLLQIIGELLAEPPETHLGRLIGLHRDLRHVPRRPSVSINTKASAFSNR